MRNVKERVEHIFDLVKDKLNEAGLKRLGRKVKAGAPGAEEALLRAQQSSDERSGRWMPTAGDDSESAQGRRGTTGHRGTEGIKPSYKRGASKELDKSIKDAIAKGKAKTGSQGTTDDEADEKKFKIKTRGGPTLPRPGQTGGY